MRVLVVEDEQNLAVQVKDALEREGRVVDIASDGEEGSFLGSTEPYDAIVLDLGLPKKDGHTVLRDWRENGVKSPVLILTARNSWRDKVAGLDSGADDYLTKPFQMDELLARLRALIRRSSGQANPIFKQGQFEFDTRSGRVMLGGGSVPLTAQETNILAYLILNRDKVVSRTELSEHVYGYDTERDSNTIEVFIGRLRRKLGHKAIVTIRGRGYQFDGAAF
ncbi:response regulator transcription factor [Rhodovulum sp. DZ06]|uniref:response regulator transcription factor n=1 Tax=Rhodovulum sp. DZ06 TaxID=3425126 RepID=UPI003D346FA3